MEFDEGGDLEGVPVRTPVTRATDLAHSAARTASLSRRHSKDSVSASRSCALSTASMHWSIRSRASGRQRPAMLIELRCSLGKVPRMDVLVVAGEAMLGLGLTIWTVGDLLGQRARATNGRKWQQR